MNIVNLACLFVAPISFWIIFHNFVCFHAGQADGWRGRSEGSAWGALKGSVSEFRWERCWFIKPRGANWALSHPTAGWPSTTHTATHIIHQTGPTKHTGKIQYTINVHCGLSKTWKALCFCMVINQKSQQDIYEVNWSRFFPCYDLSFEFKSNSATF